MLVFFLALGSACAVELDNVSNTEDSNLIQDIDNSLSSEKLEVSNELSISETSNIVNSHNDNLTSYSDDDALVSNYSSNEDNSGNLQVSEESTYESNYDSDVLGANSEINTLSADENTSVVSIDSNSSALAINSNESELGGGKTATTISVGDTHYGGLATYFKVQLLDKSNNALKNQKISLTINGKTYKGTTNDSGIAFIRNKSRI